MTLKVLELFGGIGACSKALRKMEVDFEIVDYVEIDKYAVASFNAIHDTDFEPQDITTWNKDIECDLIMHGSPCQDFSIAGKQAGGDEKSGTRSSLMYETLRIVEKLRPKYVIWENVKNILSEKHRPNFEAYQHRMASLGYRNYVQVLNAKDYGIPQNRERVFTVSILGKEGFKFPEKQQLNICLKDILESNIDEKYYLKDEQLNNLKFSNPKVKRRQIVKVCDLDIAGQDQIKRVYASEGISPTLSTMQGGNRQPKVVDPFIVASRGRGKNNEQQLEPNFSGATNTLTSAQKDNYVAIKTANSTGYDMATDGDGIDLAYPKSTTRRGRVGHGVAKTIETSPNMGCLDSSRIRKLTPKECWRLMGFDDSDFEKAAEVCSNTQLYKQAGNSIVVNVLQAILVNLLAEEQ